MNVVIPSATSRQGTILKDSTKASSCLCALGGCPQRSPRAMGLRLDGSSRFRGFAGLVPY